MAFPFVVWKIAPELEAKPIRISQYDQAFEKIRVVPTNAASRTNEAGLSSGLSAWYFFVHFLGC